MNLVDVIRGMAMGYGLKVVQIVATFVIVPFLLRDDVLGIDKYGQIFSIIAALSVVAMFLDGLKVSFSRSISQSLEEGPESTARYMGAGFKALMGASLVIGGLLVLVWPAFLRVLGITTDDDFLGAGLLGAGFVVFDNGPFAFHAYVTARGRMDFLNGMSALEAILRNVVLFVWFSLSEASATRYLVVFVGGMGLRSLSIMIYAYARWPEDFSQWWRGRVRDVAHAIGYSLPVTLVTAQYFIVQRLSIPLVNRFIGSAEAGLLSLGLNTISVNLAQVLFTVVRPILVPIAARLDLVRMSPSTRRLLLNVDALYGLCVALVTIPLVAVMPSLIGVWLGADYDSLVLPAQVLVAGTTFQVSFNVRRSILIGQGLAGEMAKLSVAASLLSFAGLVWALFFERSWAWVAGAICFYGIASTVVPVGMVFDARLLVPEARQRRGTLRMSSAWVMGLVVALLLSEFTSRSIDWRTVVAGAGALGSVLLLAHALVIRLGEGVGTVQRLRGSARRSIFGTTATGSGSG